jgi:pseudouridine kinase
VDRADHLGKPIGRAQRILCIGGAAVDRLYETAETPETGTSNPARGWSCHGGVARNAAEVLAKLGAEAALASIVGEDDSGAALVSELAACGVDTRPVVTKATARTAEYVAVFHRGELFAAFADMEILDELDGAFCAGQLATAGSIDGVFADCNLSQGALRLLRERCRAAQLPLAVDAVSLAKSQRLSDDLAGIVLVSLNRSEAQGLAGTAEPTAAVKALRRRGAATVIIADGERGVHAGDETVMFRTIMPRTEVVNVSGAGDALAAGVFLARLEGKSLREAVAFGMGCAQAALSSRRSIPFAFDRKDAELRARRIAEVNGE